MHVFHITKSRETVKHILAGGFLPRYYVEDSRWVGQADAPTIAFPMGYFCDIPLSRISDYVNFYGQYMLGITHEWGAANFIKPVIYVAGENTDYSKLRALNAHARKLDDDDIVKANNSIRYLYAHVKPSKGVMVLDGVPVEKDFYLESE